MIRGTILKVEAFAGIDVAFAKRKPLSITAFTRKADEGTIGKLTIEAVILL